MERELFKDVTKILLRMASINFIKAVVETRYMENLYKNSHYLDLESSIDKISGDLIQQVFGNSNTLHIDEWTKLAHSKELAWLFSFNTIRERIHSLANVEMFHVNEKEAERLFKRLRRDQQLLREKALKEEMEGKQKE